MRSTLGEFREQETTEAFHLQNSKLLKVELNQITIQAKLGSMVAYQGDVKFEHAGSGGVSKFIKKAVTGEGTQLMKMNGTGEVFLADQAQDIHLIYLENDQITCNGQNVLAFDAGIDWDIKKIEGGFGGALAGGLYNMALSGTGWVAVLSDGPPVLLNTGEAPTFCDPQAAITWSSNLQTTDQGRREPEDADRARLGRVAADRLRGQGWVLVQPSEGRVVATAAGSGGGGGLLGNLGG